MSEDQKEAAPLREWLAMPMEASARQAIERVRRAQDVRHVAVLPDVHLASDVCVGTVMATHRLVYPSAVGGDIGCGMFAIGFDAEAELFRDGSRAGALLKGLGERIPSRRRHRSRTVPLPSDLRPGELSHGSLAAAFKEEGSLQLGTLGGGNHFIEFQSDEDSRLWLMIHSGSRAMGQAVRAHHLARAKTRSAGMLALDVGTDDGAAYLCDQDWARRFAEANRSRMAEEVLRLMWDLFNVGAVESSRISCDHNHVRREEHFGEALLVHRKGAMPAEAGLTGVVPGSMGTLSFQVEGRGCADALCSSAHGAGRLLSRHAARERFTRADLRLQMNCVWFDPRIADSLREESPRPYKDVRAVLRAQSELVRITRVLRPLLIYKGT